MATSSQMAGDTVKEILMYHNFKESLKTLESVGSPSNKLYIMSSGFVQNRTSFKLIIYACQKWEAVTVEGMKKHISEKYKDMLKYDKEFKSSVEEVVPHMLFNYMFYCESIHDPEATSKLCYHH